MIQDGVESGSEDQESRSTVRAPETETRAPEMEGEDGGVVVVVSD